MMIVMFCFKHVSRLKKVVFSGKGSSESFASGSSTVDRKKKNFSFSRKFPFMKSKDQISGDETSDAEGECQRRLLFLSYSPNFPNLLLTTLVLTYHDEKNNH